MSGLGSLAVFDVGSNRLTGSIPSLLGLQNMHAFSVAANQLTGSIPSLASLTNLSYFHVDSNRLTGDMPSIPSPDSLVIGGSVLCPNPLSPAPNAAWDAATAVTPWYRDCAPLSDLIFSDGFDPS